MPEPVNVGAFGVAYAQRLRRSPNPTLPLADTMREREREQDAPTTKHTGKERSLRFLTGASSAIGP